MHRAGTVDLKLHPLLRVAIALTLGLAVGFGLCSLPGFSSSDVSLSLLHSRLQTLQLGASVAFLLTVVLSFLSFRRRYLSGAGILLSSFCFGLCMAVHAERKSRVILPDREVEYEAVLLSEPVRHGKVISCDLFVCGGVGKTRASILCDTMTNRYLRLHVGDGICAWSLLEHPETTDTWSASSSSFDYGQWLHVHGFRARTFIYYANWKKAAVPLSELSMLERVRLYALKARQRLVTQLMGAMNQREDLSVVLAMTLGDKSMLSPGLRDVYAVTAASHVLALSGLHLSILYTILLFLLGPLRHRLWGQEVAIATVWVYVWVVGLSPSVVRAATMLTIYGFFSLLHRRRQSLNVLSLAAIVMLIAHPHLLYDVGFQLSFLSVTAILLLMPLFESSFGHTALMRRRVTRTVCNLLAVTCAAQVGTAPLVAYYFGRVSCYFLLTSLVAVLGVTLILWVAVAFFLVGWSPTAQHVVADVLTWVAHALNHFLTTVAAWPGAAIDGLHPTRWQVVVCYLLLFIFYQMWCLYDRKLQKRYG